MPSRRAASMPASGHRRAAGRASSRCEPSADGAGAPAQGPRPPGASERRWCFGPPRGLRGGPGRRCLPRRSGGVGPVSLPSHRLRHGLRKLTATRSPNLRPADRLAAHRAAGPALHQQRDGGADRVGPGRGPRRSDRPDPLLPRARGPRAGAGLRRQRGHDEPDGRAVRPDRGTQQHLGHALPRRRGVRPLADRDLRPRPHPAEDHRQLAEKGAAIAAQEVRIKARTRAGPRSRAERGQWHVDLDRGGEDGSFEFTLQLAPGSNVIRIAGPTRPATRARRS